VGSIAGGIASVVAPRPYVAPPTTTTTYVYAPGVTPPAPYGAPAYGAPPPQAPPAQYFGAPAPVYAPPPAAPAPYASAPYAAGAPYSPATNFGGVGTVSQPPAPQWVPATPQSWSLQPAFEGQAPGAMTQDGTNRPLFLCMVQV
jgi:hypothetical protein